MNPTVVRVLFVLGAVGSLASPMPAVGLVVGVAFALTLANPWVKQTKQLSTWVLQASVVLLGFAMDLFSVLQAGREGAVAAIVSITLTLLLGMALGTVLRVPSTTSWLVSIGTAICGGSAIAACAPVLSARDDEMSAATGTVFLLNAVALFTFPTSGIGSAWTTTNSACSPPSPSMTRRRWSGPPALFRQPPSRSPRR